MKYTVEFDGRILSLKDFRFRILRSHPQQRDAPQLLKKQNGRCACCGDFRHGIPMRVHHMTPVRWFADHVEIPLDEAYVRCNSIDNMTLLHEDCHRAIHASEKAERSKKDLPLSKRLKYTVEFDTSILSLRDFRFRLLRSHPQQQHASELFEWQEGRCCHCDQPLREPMRVHHVKSVRWFADEVDIPLDEAYRQCNLLDNMELLHEDCHREVHHHEPEKPWEGLSSSMSSKALSRAANSLLHAHGHDSTGRSVRRKRKSSHPGDANVTRQQMKSVAPWLPRHSKQ